MYFLKCSNCGFDNPLKTEFLTFCEQCGKKLPVNFQEWKKFHPGKNFEDFKRENSDSKFPQTGPDLPKRSPFKIIAISAVVFIFLAIPLLLITYDGDLAGIFLPDNTPAAILKKEWQRHTYGKYGLSVETPEQLSEAEIAISSAYVQRLKDSESYCYRPSKGLQVLITSYLFDEGTRVNLEGAMVGAINELINKPGVTNVEFNQSPLLYNDVRGMLLEGAYHERGAFMKFQCVVYSRRSNLWSVWVSYRDGDSNGEKAAERIIESVEINYHIKVI